jgi:hydrogenase maturation protein HypF
LIAAIVKELIDGVPSSILAARFHNGISRSILQVALQLRSRYGMSSVALSGGVWQNLTLLQKTLPLLIENGFKVYTHRFTPTNDGGVSFGQAVVASVNYLDI